MEAIKSDNSDLKELDLKILDLLLKDSRQSFREIAGKLGVSTTTVSSRVKKMVEDSVILGFTAVVDWEKIGYKNSLCIAIQTDPKADQAEVGIKLKDIESIFMVCNIVGDYDFSIYARCRTGEDASDLLDKIRAIDGVVRVIPHTILKTTKEGYCDLEMDRYI
ncbi:MAG: Lrp/AsnC family transcriptional regulator [Halobacteriota archaeon]|nr:Lrp/AsnC family transcriptional regulator [Halobacteriota archaeon]